MEKREGKRKVVKEGERKKGKREGWMEEREGRVGGRMDEWKEE